MRNRLRWFLLPAFVLAIGACGSAPKTEDKAAEAPTAPVKPPEQYRVKLETTKGAFVVEVNRGSAPRGADHFFELVNEKFYDGVRFHRVIRGFVCQFGINGNPKVQQLWTTLQIADDPVRERNRKGTITFAMRGPNTRTTQVFINLRDNLDLDKSGFAPFGKVVEGMDVVESLYYSYGEVAPQGGGPDPSRIELQGNAYLDRQFPRLDSIRRAVVVE
jgi:peptidyl-prolyl cis-trans isomerase A (cyclophilin A)